MCYNELSLAVKAFGHMSFLESNTDRMVVCSMNISYESHECPRKQYGSHGCMFDEYIV